MPMKSRRIEQEITQKSLAEQVGVTRQMISAIENGARPSVDTAKKLAQALGMDWTEFFENDSATTAG